MQIYNVKKLNLRQISAKYLPKTKQNYCGDTVLV